VAVKVESATIQCNECTFKSLKQSDVLVGVIKPWAFIRSLTLLLTSAPNHASTITARYASFRMKVDLMLIRQA
jgi:hypothetical protein